MSRTSARLRSRVLRQVLAVTIGAVSLLPLAPADAATVAPLAFAGSGSIMPGLTAVPTNVTYQIKGAMNGVTSVGDYTVVLDNAPCAFTGSSTIAETVATGAGAGELVCDAPTGQVGTDLSRSWSWHLKCYVVWFRVGWHWRFSLRCYWVIDWRGSVMATADTVAEAVWTGAPTSVNPITSFAIAGPVLGAG